MAVRPAPQCTLLLGRQPACLERVDRELHDLLPAQLRRLPHGDEVLVSA